MITLGFLKAIKDLYFFEWKTLAYVNNNFKSSFRICKTIFIKCNNEWYLEFVFSEGVTDHTCEKQVIAILIFCIV